MRIKQEELRKKKEEIEKELEKERERRNTEAKEKLKQLEPEQLHQLIEEKKQRLISEKQALEERKQQLEAEEKEAPAPAPAPIAVAAAPVAIKRVSNANSEPLPVTTAKPTPRPSKLGAEVTSERRSTLTPAEIVIETAVSELKAAEFSEAPVIAAPVTASPVRAQANFDENDFFGKPAATGRVSARDRRQRGASSQPATSPADSPVPTPATQQRPASLATETAPVANATIVDFPATTSSIKTQREEIPLPQTASPTRLSAKDRRRVKRDSNVNTGGVDDILADLSAPSPKQSAPLSVECVVEASVPAPVVEIPEYTASLLTEEVVPVKIDDILNSFDSALETIEEVPFTEDVVERKQEEEEEMESEILYTDGSKYIGSSSNNQWEGRGKCYFANGNYYEGEVARNGMNGLGTMRYANGDEYYGQWVEDTLEGWGRYICANGDIYEGLFHNNLRHGKGIYTLSSGDRYEGEFRDGYPNGKGGNEYFLKINFFKY